MMTLFYFQYAVVFALWIIVGMIAIKCLAAQEGIDRFALAILATTVWYISAQTHWVLTMTPHMPGWIELVWSTFEGAVASVFIWALYRRCGYKGRR